MKASAKCNSKTFSTFICLFTPSRVPHSDPPGIGWFQMTSPAAHPKLSDFCFAEFG